MDEDDDNLEQDAASGSPAVPAWIERLIGRALGDLRLHDSTQAGELADRLGARGFAAGRHVYLRPELLHPRTPAATALLAHELAHAAAQTGAPARPQAPPAAPATAHLTVARRPAVAVQRAPGPGDSETQARAVEAAALQAQQPQAARRPPADPEEIAERVYRLMEADLRADSERLAGSW